MYAVMSWLCAVEVRMSELRKIASACWLRTPETTTTGFKITVLRPTTSRDQVFAELGVSREDTHCQLKRLMRSSAIAPPVRA
jgi:hypothetical protein